MKFGIMWSRAEKKPLAEDIQTAMAYIKKKYAMTPGKCLVSDKDKLEDVDIAGLSVEQSGYIPKGNIWFGGMQS